MPLNKKEITLAIDFKLIVSLLYYKVIVHTFLGSNCNPESKMILTDMKSYIYFVQIHFENSFLC